MIAAVLALVVFIGPVDPLVKLEPFPGPRLMSEKGVRQEMGISLERAYDIFSAHTSEFNLIQGRRYPTVPLPQQARAMNKILSNLTPGQKKRLGELYVRVHDTSSLLDQAVSTKLGLSLRQRIRIQELYDQGQQDFAKEIGRITEKVYKEVGYTPPAPDYRVAYTKNAVVIPKYVQEALAKQRPALRAFREKQLGNIRKEVLELLNVKQKGAFEKMKGKAPKVAIPGPMDVPPLLRRF